MGGGTSASAEARGGELDALREENAQLRRQQEEDRDTRAQMAARIDSLESELAGRDDAILTLQQRSVQLLAELDAKEEEGEQLQAAVARLERDLQHGDRTIARLERAERALRSECATSEEALRRAKQEERALQKRIDALEARLVARSKPPPPPAVATVIITPESSSSAAAPAPATISALEEENAALRKKLEVVTKSLHKLRHAGNELAVELQTEMSRAAVWEREAKMWREEAGRWHARACAVEDGDEVARIKAMCVPTTCVCMNGRERKGKRGPDWFISYVRNTPIVHPLKQNKRLD